MSELNEKILTDLLERVQKLESNIPNSQRLDEVLLNLDRIAYAHSISSGALHTVLIEKGVVSKEELKEASVKEQARIEQSLKQADSTTREEPSSAKETDEGPEEGSQGDKEEPVVGDQQ